MACATVDLLLGRGGILRLTDACRFWKCFQSSRGSWLASGRDRLHESSWIVGHLARQLGIQRGVGRIVFALGIGIQLRPEGACSWAEANPFVGRDLRTVSQVPCMIRPWTSCPVIRRRSGKSCIVLGVEQPDTLQRGRRAARGRRFSGPARPAIAVSAGQCADRCPASVSHPSRSLEPCPCANAMPPANA